MPLENETWAQAGISMPASPANLQTPLPAANQRPSMPALSPPPSQDFSPYRLLLTQLIGAGFDMKSGDDYTKFVLPALQECGGSVQAIASSIATNLNGGLAGPESFAARKAAYGHNRIPEKPMVRLFPSSALLLPCESSFHQHPHTLCRKRFGSSVSSPFKTSPFASSARLPLCPLSWAVSSSARPTVGSTDSLYYLPSAFAFVFPLEAIFRRRACSERSQRLPKTARF